MRMWMVDPIILCRKHLMGEHLEHHMFVGHIKKKKGVCGYLKNNCFEPRALFLRHQQLAEQMLIRGYQHKSELPECDISYLTTEQQCCKIDVEMSLKDLLSRCPECRKRYETIKCLTGMYIHEINESM